MVAVVTSADDGNGGGGGCDLCEGERKITKTIYRTESTFTILVLISLRPPPIERTANALNAVLFRIRTIAFNYRVESFLKVAIAIKIEHKITFCFTDPSEIFLWAFQQSVQETSL